MQPLAIKFIELLESKQLLSDDVIIELRRQVAESKVKLSPELIAKLLVDNGHLTKFQATRLVAELATDRPATTTSGSAKATEDELGLAPSTNTAEVLVDDEVVGVEAVDVIDDAVPVIDVVESVVEVVEAVEGEPASAFSFDSRPPARSSSRTKSTSSGKASIAQAGPNPWDSFRILGVAVILGIVCVAGFFLLNWMRKDSAEDAIKLADETYEQRQYDAAKSSYQTFANSWKSHEKASFARIRAVLASIRKDVEGSTPITALKTAEAQLPTIVDEPGLADQQADLAGALVSLAEKFASRMDNTKDSDQRKELMTEMDKLMAMINDSKFVGANQRTQQGPALLKIEESRARIQREIRRDDELVVALKQIDQLLEEKEVQKAYDVRKQLINQYPLLEANAELVKRVRQASETQRGLVKDSDSTAKILSEPSPDAVKSFVFAHRDEKSVTDLEGTVVYFKVKGSVYAINASNGEVLWNKYVGIGLDSYPVRMDDSPNSDVLVAEAEAGRLHRMAGESGASKWSLDFAEPILSPVIEREDLFVSTYSGKIYSLDAGTGQTKWVKQLPQSVSVSPCVVAGKKHIYQPADHSNIYLIDRQSGACAEVFYLGHRQGGIMVQPVLVQGLLFVIENISNDAARIRILQPANEGMKSVQNAIAIEGSVIAKPTIDRTRVLVQSDLGTTLALDVESNNEKDKVTVMARIPKNLDTPKLTWTAFNQNSIWLAEGRLARFDLVVSTGTFKRDWSENEGDQFVAPLQLFGKTLIHARRLRGNQGVRITAIGAADRQEYWKLDLAEPVSVIVKKQQKGFGAITSSGNYFSVTNKPLITKADASASQSAGMRWFANPTWLSPTQAILLNRSNAKEFALYNEGTSPLRLLNVAFGSASPTSEAVLAGDKLVVGLDNGQLVMFDPTTGSLIGAPYQPALKPNAKVLWNKPVYLAESRSIVIASDLKRIVRLDTKDSLRQISDAAVENNLIGPLAVVGTKVVAVQAGGSADEILVFDSTSLAESKGSILEGKLVAGPFGGAEVGLVQTNQKLLGIDSDGKAKWTIEFPNSQIVGEPVMVGSNFLISTRAGNLWSIDSSSGEILGSSELGQPLSTAPMVVDGRVLLGTDEGAILVTTIPTAKAVGGQQ